AHDGTLLLLRRRMDQCPAEDVRALAKALGVSQRTLQRALRARGTSFRAEARLARVRVACRLLLETSLKIEAIAREVGYVSTSHFAEAFRGQTGVSPRQFRRAHDPMPRP